MNQINFDITHLGKIKAEFAWQKPFAQIVFQKHCPTQMETQYQPEPARGKYEKRAAEDADTPPLRGFYVSSEALFSENTRKGSGKAAGQKNFCSLWTIIRLHLKKDSQASNWKNSGPDDLALIEPLKEGLIIHLLESIIFLSTDLVKWLTGWLSLLVDWVD